MKIRNWIVNLRIFKVPIVLRIFLAIAISLIIGVLVFLILNIIPFLNIIPWLILLGVILSLGFFFRPWNFKPFATMENLIKILTILIFTLLIHVLLIHSLLLEILPINDILEALELKNFQNSDEKIGYIIGGIAGFTALLWGLNIRNKQLEVFSNRNKSLDEHSLEDRFIRSVELTGNKEQAIRLGGLEGLETLMYENAILYKRVLKYFGKFLRSPTDLDGWKSLPIDSQGTLRCQQISEKKETKGVLIGERPDIEYIVQILRDKSEKEEQLPEWMKKEDSLIPFEYVHLEGAKLSEVSLKNANLTGAHLEGTKLIEVNLENAILKGADLSKANLEDTNITGTDLRETKYLTKPQLKKCYYYVEAPPLLPAGWDPKKIGIQEKQREEE